MVARRRHLSADVPLRSIGGNLVVFSGGESRPIPSSALDVQELIELSIQRTSRCRLSFPLHLVFEKKRTGDDLLAPNRFDCWSRRGGDKRRRQFQLSKENRNSLSLSSKGRKFGRQTRSTYTKKQKTHACNTKCTNIYLFLFRADEPSYSSETSRQRQQRR